MPDLLSYPSKWLRRSHVLRAIFSEGDLPVLPEILRKLEKVLEDSKAGSGDIAVLVEKEPVIAARVLSLANSAYYGSGRQQINSIDRAVSRLGLKTISGLVYAAIIPEMLHKGGYNFNHFNFWRHSLTVAFLARDLVLRRDKNAVDNADKAYMAGLLHDVGILLLASALPEVYENFQLKGDQVDRDLYYVEDELFGIDHSEVGAILIERHWHLDPEIVQAVRMHHKRPAQQSASHSFSLEVYVANAICSMYGISNGVLKGDRLENLSLLATLADLGYDMESLERHLQLAKDGVSDIEEMLKR